MTKEIRLHNDGKTNSSTNGAGKIGQLDVKKKKKKKKKPKLDHPLKSYRKISSKLLKT